MKKSIVIGTALGLLSAIIYYTQMYIQFSISNHELLVAALLGAGFGFLFAFIFVFSSTSGHGKTFLFWVVSAVLFILLCETAGMTPNNIYYAMMDHEYHLGGGGGFALLFTTAYFFFFYFLIFAISCLILSAIQKNKSNQNKQ